MDFDAVFDLPDEKLWLNLVGRIEGPDWSPDHIQALAEPERHLVCLMRFEGIFGNGGLQYWFESFNREDCEWSITALHAVGLTDAAEALRAAVAAVPDYDDWGGRMAALGRPEFNAYEDRLWAAFDSIGASVAAYARAHRGAFERLRARRPWDSVEGRYED